MIIEPLDKLKVRLFKKQIPSYKYKTVYVGLNNSNHKALFTYALHYVCYAAISAHSVLCRNPTAGHRP